MTFQEYPKGLFKNGDPAGEFCIVASPVQESDARDAGFTSIGDSVEFKGEQQDNEPAPKRRGRPPKAKE